MARIIIQTEGGKAVRTIGERSPLKQDLSEFNLTKSGDDWNSTEDLLKLGVMIANAIRFARKVE